MSNSIFRFLSSYIEESSGEKPWRIQLLEKRKLVLHRQMRS